MTTIDKPRQKGYQDIVDYKPIVLKVIEDEKRLKYLLTLIMVL